MNERIKYQQYPLYSMAYILFMFFINIYISLISSDPTHTYEYMTYLYEGSVKCTTMESILEADVSCTLDKYR